MIRTASLVLLTLASGVAAAQPRTEVVTSREPAPVGASLDTTLVGKWRIEAPTVLGEEGFEVRVQELAILFRADGLTTTLATAVVAGQPPLSRLTVFTAWSEGGRVFSPDDLDGEPYELDDRGGLLIAMPGGLPGVRLVRVPERLPAPDAAGEEGP